MDYLGKKYKFTKGDDLTDFFKAYGVGNSAAEAAKDFGAPVTELVQNGDGTFTLTVGTAAGSMVRTFTPGKELDEESWGAKSKSTFTVEANKLIQVQKVVNGNVVTIVREFTPTTLTTTNTVEGWNGKAVRHFEAI